MKKTKIGQAYDLLQEQCGCDKGCCQETRTCEAIHQLLRRAPATKYSAHQLMKLMLIFPYCEIAVRAAEHAGDAGLLTDREKAIVCKALEYSAKLREKPRDD